MKSNKILQLSICAFFALPLSLLFGNEMRANNLFNGVGYQSNYENLLACGGGGGGGGGGSKPGALKSKKLNNKLNFKKRQLSKMAAAGEDTSSLQAEIKEIEAAIAELN